MMTFIKKHLWILVLIVSLILIPQSLNIQSELSMRIIVTAIGVDYLDDGKFQVIAQVVRPSDGSTSEGGSAGLDFITTEGDTVSDAMYKASFLIGKTAGLGHVNAVAFGKSVVEKEKLEQSLDYFVRDTRIPTACLLLICDGEAKDEFKKSKSLELSNAVGMQKLFLYKELSMNGTMMQLGKFVNDYYRIGGTGLISEIKFVDEISENSESAGNSGAEGGTSGESSGGNSSGESSGGNQNSQSGGSSQGGGSGGQSGNSSQGSGGQNGGEPSQRVVYDNNVYLFKNGKKALIFTEKEGVYGLNYANPKSTSGIITLEDVSDDEYYDNARVSMFVRDKRVKIAVDFSGDLPKCKMTISTSRNEVIEIENESGEKLETLYVQSDFITEELKDKLKSKMRNEVLKTFSLAQEVQADVFHLGEQIYSLHPKKWHKFYEKFGEDYINQIEFDVEVKVNKRL